MRFQTSGKYVQGVADADPIASPETITVGHVMSLPDEVTEVSALYFGLAGTGVESLTVDIYLLYDETDLVNDLSRYINANNRWELLASGIVVVNGVLEKVNVDAPGGGTIYVRRTADTITASQTRVLVTRLSLQ